VYNVGNNVNIYSNALSTLNTIADSWTTQIEIYAAAGTRRLTINLTADMSISVQDATATSATLVASSDSDDITVLLASAVSINVDLDAELSLSTLTAPDATELVISGSSSFFGSHMTLHAGASIDASASAGTITVNLQPDMNFIGGSGRDVVTIDAAPLGVISGGSANNEIILESIVNASEATLAHVTHFSTLTFAGTTSGTFDMSKLPDVNVIDMQGNSANLIYQNYNNAANGTVLEIPYGVATLNIDYGSVSTTGAKDSLTVVLGDPVAYDAAIASLTVADHNGAGIGTINISSNNATGYMNTINTFIDNGLAILNISGDAPLQIAQTITDSAASVAFNDNAGHTASNIANLVDAALSTLAIGGTEAFTLGSVVTGSANLTLIDNDTAAVTISNLSADSITSLTIYNTYNSGVFSIAGSLISDDKNFSQVNLNGNVEMTLNDDADAIIINGASDNAGFTLASQTLLAAGAEDDITFGNGSHNITLGYAQVGSVENIKVGNGSLTFMNFSSGVVNLTAGNLYDANNLIDFLASPEAIHLSLGNGGTNQIYTGGAKDVTISVGDGQNSIDVTAAGASGTISISSHTLGDHIVVNSLGADLDIGHIMAIKGLNNIGADSISFPGVSVVAIGAAKQVVAADVSGNSSTLASWVAAAVGQSGLVAQTENGIHWFQFGGNTYLVSTPTATDHGVVSADDCIVKLVGLGYNFAHSSTNSYGAFLLNG